MTWIRRNSCNLATLVVLSVAACATTQLNSSWKDPAYQGHPKKILVIGVAKQQTNRRVFEDEFVRQLSAHGAQAIVSYLFFPGEKEADKASIAAKMKEEGADAVLITRLVSKKTVQYYVPGAAYYPPPYYGTWPDYYGYGYQAMYTPGYMAEGEYALVETNLYDSSNDKLIWSALSETETRGADAPLIKSFIGVMVNAMVEQNLLRK